KIFGKRGEKSDWHPLVVTPGRSGEVTLTKDWDGAIEKTAVNGEKNLWLRAEFVKNVGMRENQRQINTLALSVKTDDSKGAANSSDSIEAALHKGTPLPVTTAFLPFGPEPLRFDTFALSAPEVFSKKGATAILNFTLSDETLLAMSVVVAAGTPSYVFGISTNG